MKKFDFLEDYSDKELRELKDVLDNYIIKRECLKLCLYELDCVTITTGLLSDENFKKVLSIIQNGNE